MLVDVHMHLDHEHYKDKIGAVIGRAKQAGVKYILTSGVNPASNRRARELAQQYDIVHWSAGLYPVDLLNTVDGTGLPRQTEPFDMDAELQYIKQHKDEVMAVGEIGLDGKYCADQMPQQKKNFETILSFVEKLKKPVVIHSRKAEREVLDILESSTVKKVNLHCFMGNKKLIKRAEDLGYYFSVPALIVKLQHFQMMAEMVNLNQLLTETDGPWLSPFSDQMNEPAFVKETIQQIANIKNVTPEEVTNNVFMNFQKVFLQ